MKLKALIFFNYRPVLKKVLPNKNLAQVVRKSHDHVRKYLVYSNKIISYYLRKRESKSIRKPPPIPPPSG